MNEYIKEIVESWGISTDTNVITAIIVLISVITMCAVFWLILHIVSPNASHFREMCFKVIITTTAVLLVITTFIGIGGNVVIREYTKVERTNANLRISQASYMDEYQYNDTIVNGALEEIFAAFGSPVGLKLYAAPYSYQGAQNALMDSLFPIIAHNVHTGENYSLYTKELTLGTSEYVDSVNVLYDPNFPIDDSMVGAYALINGEDYYYKVVALNTAYKPYALYRFEGEPIMFEFDANVAYDPNYN